MTVKSGLYDDIINDDVIVTNNVMIFILFSKTTQPGEKTRARANPSPARGKSRATKRGNFAPGESSTS